MDPKQKKQLTASGVLCLCSAALVTAIYHADDMPAPAAIALISGIVIVMALTVCLMIKSSSVKK